MLTREVFTVTGMSLTAFCGGSGNVGIGITGSGTWTITFSGSKDGVYFFPVYPIPFPSGTGVNTVTAAGNYFLPVKDLIALKATIALTSGTPTVIMSAANDSTWQDAFLASGTIYNNASTNSGGTVTLTQTAQANRAWTLTSCNVSFAGPGFGGNGKVTVYDGTIAGTVLWQEYLASGAGSVGTSQSLNIPKDKYGNQGITGTPGNAVTIVVTGIGGGTGCTINSQFSAG